VLAGIIQIEACLSENMNAMKDFSLYVGAFSVVQTAPQ
jgi:hypothetical protein